MGETKRRSGKSHLFENKGEFESTCFISKTKRCAKCSVATTALTLCASGELQEASRVAEEGTRLVGGFFTERNDRFCSQKRDEE